MPSNLSLPNSGGILSPNQINLSLDQRRLYDRLRAMGIEDMVARQLAVAVAKSVGAEQASAAMGAVAVRKKSYHEAFVDAAKSSLHPKMFEVLHNTARSSAGGYASGASRRAAKETADTPVAYPLRPDQDVLDATVLKADDSLSPPAGVRAACRRGLDLMGEHGGPGLTEGAKARARSMAAGDSVTLDQVRRMKAYFSRHTEEKTSSPPSPGYVAWLLWGGDAGKAWASSQVSRLEKGGPGSGPHPGEAAKAASDKASASKSAADHRAASIAHRAAAIEAGAKKLNGDRSYHSSMAAYHSEQAKRADLVKGQKPLGAAYSRARAKTKDKKKQKQIANAYLKEKGHAPVGKAAAFNEEDHPRDDAGKFSDGGGTVVAGRTSASAGLHSSYGIGGVTNKTDNAHEHLENARFLARAADEAANKGNFSHAAQLYNEASQHTFHAQDLARSSSIRQAGKGRASKEAIEEEKRGKATAKLHSDAAARASKAGDQAKSYLHFLAAGTHSMIGSAAKNVSRAKLPDLGLVKAQQAMALVKGLGVLPQEIAVPTESEASPPKKKKKYADKDDKKKVAVSLEARIVKAEQQPWQNLVYSVVYEPDQLDTDGDFMDAATIEKAAHEAMAAGIYINHEHQGAPLGAHVVESYIAPCEMALGPSDGQQTIIRKGTWMMAMKVTDQEVWDRVLDGTYGGFSLEGSALAEMASAAS